MENLTCLPRNKKFFFPASLASFTLKRKKTCQCIVGIMPPFQMRKFHWNCRMQYSICFTRIVIPTEIILMVEGKVVSSESMDFLSRFSLCKNIRNMPILYKNTKYRAIRQFAILFSCCHYFRQNGEESKRKMMSPGTEMKTTIKWVIKITIILIYCFMILWIFILVVCLSVPG